jgi:hypothetical protein
MDMMAEFGLPISTAISDFILTNSREATLERINALAPGRGGPGTCASTASTRPST